MPKQGGRKLKVNRLIQVYLEDGWKNGDDDGGSLPGGGRSDLLRRNSPKEDWIYSYALF